MYVISNVICVLFQSEINNLLFVVPTPALQENDMVQQKKMLSEDEFSSLISNIDAL